MERTLFKEGLSELGCIVHMGRALTRKMGRKRHGLKGCEVWYHPDGVHLSEEGYEKLARAGSFPEWLTIIIAGQRPSTTCSTLTWTDWASTSVWRPSSGA